MSGLLPNPAGRAAVLSLGPPGRTGARSGDRDPRRPTVVQCAASGDWQQALSQSVARRQRLIEVGDEVGGRLDAQRKPDEVVADAETGPLLGRQAAV